MRNPVVAGRRVYLRALEPADGEILAHADAVEAETFMYRGRRPSSPLDWEAWFKALTSRTPPAEVALAVCLREDERMIGEVGIGDLDWVHRHGETGSLIALPEHRGKGLGTEAKHLLLEYAFDVLGLHVLQSVVEETNTRSAAALAKQGYRPAGRRRRADVKGRRFIDQLRFDVTREDWVSARERWLAGSSLDPASPSSEPRLRG